MKAKPLLDVTGATALLLGLVFVGLEIRQNTNAMRGTTVQAIAEMSLEASLTMAQDDELAEALRIAEARFRQIGLGILGEDEIVIGGASLSFYESEWFETWWELNGRQDASPDFAAWVESEILPLR